MKKKKGLFEGTKTDQKKIATLNKKSRKISKESGKIYTQINELHKKISTVAGMKATKGICKILKKHGYALRASGSWHPGSYQAYKDKFKCTIYIQYNDINRISVILEYCPTSPKLKILANKKGTIEQVEKTFEKLMSWFTATIETIEEKAKKKEKA